MPDQPLTQQQLTDLLNGATFLGSGGGGPYEIGEQLIQDILKTGPVSLQDPSTVLDTDAMAVGAGVGSPNAAGGFDPTCVPNAFTALEKKVQATYPNGFQYVVPGEIGAGNTFIPLYIAAKLNIAALDAAGAARAIPTFMDCTFAESLPISPIAVADGDAQIFLEVPTVQMGEDAVHAILSGGVFGETTGIAFWAMSGAQMKATAIFNTTSQALALGRIIRESSNKIPDVLRQTSGKIIFQGILKTVNDTTTGGFDVGSIILTAANGATCTIYNVNENLIAFLNSSPKPLAVGPDLICYITPAGQPFSNAEAQTYVGKEVIVIAVPAPRQMRSQPIISAFLQTLQSVGYGGAYFAFNNLGEN